jgi:hypothetical protein
MRALRADVSHHTDQIRGLEAAVKVLKRRIDSVDLAPIDELEIQSSDESKDETTNVETTKVQNMEFADGTQDDTWGFEASMDPTMDGIPDAYSLGDFLSRPTLIQSYSIPQGEAFNIRSFFPWRNFFTNSVIEQKLDHFGFIRCNLKIKVLVNSSPFIYGAYGLSYHPRQNYNESLRPIGVATDIPMLSQMPTIMIESHKNKGGEMTLPFFYQADWVKARAIELAQMGELHLFPYSSFASANGTATSDVDIRIYAWAEDVHLAANTGLTVQAQDEYGVGPVSSVASAIASMSSRLEDVPIIGKFARASTIGASATSKIASLFGWTNVPVIEDAMPYKSVPFHGLASSSIAAPVEKLTLDPKNELTVDPCISGLPNNDEMSIAYIAQKPSYLTSFEWQQSDSPLASKFLSYVTPTLCDAVSATGYTEFHDTPMGHVSRLFYNWRGTIIFKVKVVASPYHQGRLRITYDPRYDIFADSDTENVSVTKFIDLSITDEAHFEIPWQQNFSWGRVQTDIVQGQSATTTPAVLDEIFHNGRFTIRVANSLTGPDTASSVRVLVSVMAGEDFELANPHFGNNEITPLAVQSADEVISADGVTKYVMGEKTSKAADLNVVYMGESIRSVRPLLRRSCLYEQATYDFTNVSGSRMALNFHQNAFPCHRGYAPRGVYTTPEIVGGGNANANQVMETPIAYMSTCYMGMRGSIHWHFNHLGPEVPSLSATRFIGATGKIAGGDRPARSSMFLTDEIAVTGLSLINERTQTGLEVSVPFYSRNKFVGTDPYYMGSGVSRFDYNLSDHNITVDLGWVAQDNDTNTHGIDSYVGAGTDFQLLFFVAVPTKYRYSLPGGTINTNTI